MIEGGSRVLSSFLRSPPRSDGSPVVDSVIITVAPMFIGDGVGVVPKVCRPILFVQNGADGSRRTKLPYQI
jgi:riboflavin biosynthesis pyrimidine reductase